MDHQAHGLDLTHPIFHSPNEVHFTFTEAVREKQYEDATSVRYPDGMGATFQLTAFEKDKPDGWNPIMVNHEGFFTDVPGLENIAEGHAEKSLGSLALARQGRWFYWGFSIDPERTTDAAKDTLINVLHYMRGQRDSVSVSFVCVTRQIFLTFLDLNRRSGYLRGIEEHMPGQLTEATRATYTDRSPAGAKAWLDENLPFLFSGKGPQHQSPRYKAVFELDTDAKALGTPNKERQSLERWLALAADPASADHDFAVRCLLRYVHPDIAPKDGDWAAWHRRFRDRIVFIESTGFWWQEDPRLLERERRAAARAR